MAKRITKPTTTAITISLVNISIHELSLHIRIHYVIAHLMFSQWGKKGNYSNVRNIFVVVVEIFYLFFFWHSISTKQNNVNDVCHFIINRKQSEETKRKRFQF